MDTENTSGRIGTVPATKFVVLLRVSTKHQGADGLGIAAQKRDIELFLSTQQGAERYTDDPRDLCNVRNLDAFYERLRECMCNCKRLIKNSDWEKKEFHPVVMKAGSVRRLQQGLHNMSTEVELIARDLGLVLHDTFFNHLTRSMRCSRCLDVSITDTPQRSTRLTLSL